jgi:hypothetical protein
MSADERVKLTPEQVDAVRLYFQGMCESVMAKAPPNYGFFLCLFPSAPDRLALERISEIVR